VSIPVDILLRLGCDPLSLPEGGKNLDPGLSSLLLSGGTLRDVFTLNWTGLSGLLTIFGGLNPATGSLWLTDVAHHHLAVAVTFLVAGHLYRTQFSALWMPSSTDTGPWMYPRTNCPKVAGQLKLQFVNTWYRHA
jgi:photosystem I P700 chlorophyll a apoprotein A1